MNPQFIKILDQTTALKLAESGFSYMIENVNNMNVFVFVHSDELMKELQINYANEGILWDDKLRF